MAGFDPTSLNWIAPDFNFASKQTSAPASNGMASMMNWGAPKTAMSFDPGFSGMGEPDTGGIFGGMTLPAALRGGNGSLDWASGALDGAKGGNGGGWFSNLIGKDNLRDAFGGTNADGTKDMGYAGVALGGLQSLASLWSGMKNYGLMKDQLAFQKDSFNKNFNNQVQTTNTQLADRQAARVASNPGAYQSVDDYLKKNRVGG